MHIERTRKYLHWLIPLSIVGSLSIFASTFLTYSLAHSDHRVGSYTPAILGVLSFAILMTSISYLSLPGPRSWVRFFTAVGIAILESMAFYFLLMLQLVNTFGS